MTHSRTRRSAPADVARTFEAARWADSKGRPVCPTCFDGEDLRVVNQATRTQARRGELPLYHCGCCRRYLATVKGTPLERSDLPLVYWAYFVMAGLEHNWTQLSREWGVPRRTLHRITRRLEGQNLFVERWRGEMRQSGITVQQLHQRAMQEGAT